MAGLTNKFKYQVLNWVFEGQEANVPATFFIPLYTSTTAPNPDHNVIGDMEEAPAGNGYTAGGVEVTAATDFDSLTEDDSGDKATVQVVDVTWTASGGIIPGSGGDLFYAGLTDANATTASRELYAMWSLGSDRTVSDGQELTLQDCEIDINES